MDDIQTALAQANEYGLSIEPAPGGWRVSIFDPRLDILSSWYNPDYRDRWKENGHSGPCVVFYAATIPEVITKAMAWLDRQPAIAGRRLANRRALLREELPADQCIN